jgi:hypothetical protein
MPCAPAHGPLCSLNKGKEIGALSPFGSSPSNYTAYLSTRRIRRCQPVFLFSDRRRISRSPTNRMAGVGLFYVAERHGAPLLLVPSLGGVPEVAVPTYPILRVSYLSLESTASEQGMTTAKTELQGAHPLLLSTSAPSLAVNQTCTVSRAWTV